MSGIGSVTSPMTSDSVPQPPTRALRRWNYSEWIDLRRLKVVSLVLPILFIVALELALFANAKRRWLWDGYHLILIVVTVLSIITFGLVMFHFINRVQQQVLRQNRELTGTNAVSSAVQNELSVDRIIEVALESVLSWSGATEVSVTIFTPQGTPPDANSRTHHRRAERPSPSLGVDDLPSVAAELVEIPLYTGIRVVGQMRLHLPTAANERDGLSSDMLQNIGHQLACAIQRGQLVADLERRNQESNAFHDVLLQISNQSATADILTSVVQHARQLVSSDKAVICLNEGVSQSVRLDETAFSSEERTSIASESGHIHENHLICTTQSSPEWAISLTVPLRGQAGTLGDLWIARRLELPFTTHDQEYLNALSGLATIAITSAQARESERQGTILAERERIAREMHDSLAQVLGVIHLRLRALDSHPEIKAAREIKVEVVELADICEEAYHDVREAILGLRESSKSERGLLESLRAYLVKFSNQCGIKTSLSSDLDHELTLSPRCEVQMIRVIQEALTNVRKHSGAKSVIVRITESSAATTFVVEDDGHGFDQDGSLFNRDGFGLFTMRERLGLLNGSLTIDSAPGQGTRIIATVPERSHPRPVPIEVMNANR